MVGRDDETIDRGGGGAGTPAPLGRLGPYVIERELARGGMGCVYIARHAELGRQVALKTILGRSPRALVRFQTEARATARLQHPNIVTVHEVGVDQNVHYLVMELVPGESLKERISREGRLDAREAARITALLARALDYAHAQGILHRDMKPANILLRDGEPVITDFGLAKDSAADEGLTKTGQMIGTPVYMPPEQAQGKRHLVDGRSDVYSLGATLYEALTGHVPFKSESAMNLIVAVVTQAPARPSTLVADLDRELERICMRCLEKAPGDRYATGAALADALEAWLAGGSSPPRAPRRVIAGALALAVLLLATLAFVLAADRPPSTGPSPDTARELELDALRKALAKEPSPGATADDDASAAAPAIPRTAFRRWRQLEPREVLTSRLGLAGAFSFDPVGRRLLQFGGSRGKTFLQDTWAWDGTSWTSVRLGLATLPPEPRYAHRTATDQKRERIVLFGGVAPDRKLNDTWEFTGEAWIPIPKQSPRPAARAWHGLAWDPTRERVLLFGGMAVSDGAESARNDLWSWDGARWREIERPNDGSPWPEPRDGFGFALDPRRHRIVLFGGTNRKGGGQRNDVWEWDGARWHAIEKRGVWPLPRHGHELAWEGDRLLVFGGLTTEGGRRYLGDTWAWDGERWTELAPEPAPSARAWLSMEWDPIREALVLSGGDDGRQRNDTWVFAEPARSARTQTWRRVDTPTAPSARIGLSGALSFDPQQRELVQFGGKAGAEFLGDTWAWTGESWRFVGAGLGALPPAPRFAHRSATDFKRGRVVLFGGNLPDRRINATWEWRDPAWHRVPPVQPSPPTRAWHAMSWDGEHVLLFGGKNFADAPLNDLWRFDGTRWREIPHAEGAPWPSGLSACGFAFDPRRQRVVLFGGSDARGQASRALWEWDGARWHEIPPSTPWPPARQGMGLCWEGEQMLLFGGLGPDQRRLDDTWTWDGKRWTRRRHAETPSRRAWHAMAWDPARERVVLTGGDDGQLRSDTWIYGERR